MSEPGRKGGWLAFWSRPHKVYVNDRHRRVHYARLADDIVSVLPGPGAVVLDFGCGEALFAERVAAHCSRLYLCEAAEPVRAALAARFGGHPVIRVIDGNGLAGLQGGHLDLVVVSSVLQYLSVEELRRLLQLWRAKLSATGLLVLADVLPPDSSALADTMALLRFAAREGFLLAALGGLASLALGDYRRLRNRLGLTRWDPEALPAELARAGLAGERRPVNLGFDPNRMTFLARPARASSGRPGPEGPAAVGEERPEHDEPGGDELGRQIVQAEPVAEDRHRQAGEREADRRHQGESGGRSLVWPVAREGPAAVQEIGDHPAQDVAGEGRGYRTEAAELDREHERAVVTDGREHTHEREAPELPEEEAAARRDDHRSARPQTQPPSQT